MFFETQNIYPLYMPIECMNNLALNESSTPAESYIQNKIKSKIPDINSDTITIYRVVVSTKSIEKAEEYKQILKSKGLDDDEIHIAGKLTGATLRVYADSKPSAERKKQIILKRANASNAFISPHNVTI